MPPEAVSTSLEPSSLVPAVKSMVLGWGTVALVYFASGWLTGWLTGWLSTDATIIPQVWLDETLGFTVNAVWWYLSFFLLIPYTYFSVHPNQLLTLRYAMQISALISGFFFVLMPTSLVYPEITQTGLNADLLKLLISVDSPNNCFPSLHASLTTICVVSGVLTKRFFRSAAFLLVGIAILASIIMLRRHLTIDVGGGVVVGLLLYAAASYFSRSNSVGQTHR